MLDTALAMIEAGGVGALSMRKLAAELGVAPSSIYWHVGGREQLLGRLADRVLADLGAFVASGDDPATRIMSIATALRAQIMDHPSRLEITAAVGRGPAVSFPAQVALAREVAAAGLEGEAAAVAVRDVMFLVGSYVTLGLNRLDRERLNRVSTRQLWNSEPPDDVDPAVIAIMRAQAELDEVFAHTLDVLVHGLLAGVGNGTDEA